jgi:hypothetical protein
MEIKPWEILRISQMPVTIALGAARIAVEQVVGNDTSIQSAGRAVEARKQAEEELNRRLPTISVIQVPVQDVVIDLTGTEPVVSAEVLPGQQIESVQ